MGDARRRQLAGDAKPDKRWQGRKAAERHVKQVAREMRIAAYGNPTGMAAALIAGRK